MNPYEVLGVNKNATEQEIKHAYRKLVMTAHPDVGGNTELFNAIKNAFEILMNKERRTQFDSTGSTHINRQSDMLNDQYITFMQGVCEKLLRDNPKNIKKYIRDLIIEIRSQGENEKRKVVEKLKSVLSIRKKILMAPDNDFIGAKLKTEVESAIFAHRMIRMQLKAVDKVENTFQRYFFEKPKNLRRPKSNRRKYAGYLESIGKDAVEAMRNVLNNAGIRFEGSTT